MQGSNSMLVVNMYGGPGSGKSTLATDLFQELKRRGVNCEYVSEFAKDKCWEGNTKVFSDQLYIFGKQHWKQSRMKGEVDVIITDSPLPLTIVYNSMAEVPYVSLEGMVLEAFSRYNNLNVFVKRDKPYNPKGRNQTEDEARELDGMIRNVLETFDIPFMEYSGSSRAADLAEIVQHRIRNLEALDAIRRLQDAEVLDQEGNLAEPYREEEEEPGWLNTNLYMDPVTEPTREDWNSKLRGILDRYHLTRWDDQARDRILVEVKRFCQDTLRWTDAELRVDVQWEERELKIGFLRVPEKVLTIRYDWRLDQIIPDWVPHDKVTISFKSSGDMPL